MKKRGNGIKLVPAEKRAAFLAAFNEAFAETGLTPSSVAGQIDADASWLTRILHGERGMDIYDLFRVCEILGVNPGQVVGAYPVNENPEGRCVKVVKKLNDAIPDDLWEELRNLREGQKNK